MRLLLAWQLDGFALAVAAATSTAWFLLTPRRRPLVFVAGVALFLLATLSPVAVLARSYLFSAHMLQHIVLVLVVPPLVLLAWPPSNKPVLAVSTGAFLPWLLGVGAMWLWHAPTLCDAASRSLLVFRFQTLSLLAMGAAFWLPVIDERRLPPFAAIVYLFTACAACTVLGVYVTFSPVAICSVFANPADTLGVLPLLRDRWGLGPKADQEVGGLLMWVPGCVVYAGSILAMYARFMRGDVARAKEVG